MFKEPIISAMNIDFNKASFKDFEQIPGMDAYERAAYFDTYLNFLDDRGHLNYRIKTVSGCGPEVMLELKGKTRPRKFISLVSNDYLGFTQHPEVKAAAVAAIGKYGTGTGASPAIGGHFDFHEALEQKIAGFFRRGSAIVYTTGYTANSASLQSLLRRNDLAILDMAVHASVYEGCLQCDTKRFPHNNLQELERILTISRGKYQTRMVIIDGVYSQDGDFAHLPEIVKLCKQYGAYLVVDDAHGTGVIGKTGRGVIEHYDLFQEVDIITGTFSKSFAHIGGYLIAKPEVVRYLKFQARQHLFSVTAAPASACILKSIDLIDEEPQWMRKLWENVEYFKSGLKGLGLNTGNTQSAIIPVKIGDPYKTAQAAKLLMDAGIYTNPIIYPAVSPADARIRMSVMATHTFEHLDQVLNAFEQVSHKLNLKTTAAIV
ncbi:aminotransferase class I/II-fold pyridoxal phosphate-dependent enzyme [Mucilaginibacter pineti]|uniref:aminotransferase class I/II-fold pyridoxal phosphate-dependent enzyme n=1 Tax=Mucilaginibacter pineti TaxID=1391627 RepID=UPI001F0806CC|nr:aminotransferase class I/II-fold pyridoxal phosphate-dependent enzyme [Mucilaginibacter pineti]